MKLKDIIEAADTSYEIMAKLRQMAKGSTGPIRTGRRYKGRDNQADARMK